MQQNIDTKNNIDILIRDLDEEYDDLEYIRDFSETKNRMSKESFLSLQYPSRKSTHQTTGSHEEENTNVSPKKSEDVINYEQVLNEKFDTMSPFFYLNKKQKNKFLKNLEIFTCQEAKEIYTKTNFIEMNQQKDAYILITGEVHIINEKNEFIDLVDTTSLFGYDAPIFNKRFNTIIAEKESVIGKISKENFLEILTEVTQFNSFLTKSIILKDKVLDNLSQLRNYILFSIDQGPINMKELIFNYKKIYPCLHSGANTKEFDFEAWSYALNRLPKKVLETFVYIVMNISPTILSTSDELILDLMPRVHSNLRKRDIIQTLNGKNVIMLREMETDLIDFCMNMCIHMIESKKIRKFITPLTLGKIYACKDNIDKVMEILKELSYNSEKKFSDKEINSLKKMFGVDLGINLIKISMHYQNYSINICKLPINDIDPIENWVQNIWRQIRNILGLNSSIKEVDDLIVDIIQGSRKSMLNCFSSHIYKNQEEIYKWAKDNNIQTKTQKFNCETDRLIAFSYYYYEKFPEKMKELEELNSKNGIYLTKETYSTGVKVLIINTNKLDHKNIDPNLKCTPPSKNHIILHIGYNFGAQSAHLIKPLFMLLNSKARSINIIGKAGGLQGQRTNILIANKMYLDSSHELSNINTGNIDIERVMNETKTKVHFGPMLTVTGTILQNYDLLNFYKNVRGCVGIDMEGFYFANEVQKAVKQNVLHDNFLTRCFYYISDLPLDPTQVLSQEGGIVSWEEGVASINAIQRYILNEVCK